MLNPSLNLSQKVLALVSVPILFMLIFVLTLANLERLAEDAIWRERHYKDVSNECNSLISNFLNAASNLGLYKTTNQRQFFDTFCSLCDVIPEQVRTLKFLLKEDAKSSQSLAELEAASNEALEGLHRARKYDRYSLSKDFLGDEEQLTMRFVQILRRVVKEQHDLNPDDVRVEEKLRFLISQWLSAGVAISIVLAVVLAVIFNRSTTRRLLALIDNTERLRSQQKLLPRQDGSDEIARLDKVFHDMAEALDQAAQRKNELLSIVAHDLRTPLSAVQGSLSLLSAGASGQLPEPARKNVDLAERNVEQLILQINDLLDVERTESGQLQLVYRAVVVEELFERVSAYVSTLAAQKQIEIDFQPTECILHCDDARMARVLTNLLANAIKFSPAGSRIIVSAAQDGRDIEFKVIDRGRGIPKSQLSTIFDRYHQVDEADAKFGRGSGLGLSICKTFVEAHGGTITVQSEEEGENKGSCFSFRVPSERISPTAVPAI